MIPNAKDVLEAIIVAGRKATERRECSAQTIVGGLLLTVHVGANCREITNSKIEWRRCEDELPANSEDVMLHCPGTVPDVWPGYYEPLTGEWHDAEGTTLEDDEEPTHWGNMPLPPIDGKIQAKTKAKRRNRK